MAVLPIRTFGDPALRQRARDVGAVRDVHRRLISDMFDTMRAAPGVGLAAPQVGVLERIFVWEVDEEHGAVVNPEITVRSPDAESDDEGCLSLPGLLYPVERAVAVTVKGMDESGNPLEIDAEGLQAVVFQHEIDHLDGVLFIDRLPDELRKDALKTLRDQALGLVPPPPPVPAEESL
jgi:peptide deformylase